MNNATQTRWMNALGYAGLIPFLGFGLLTALYRDTDMAAMFAHYNMLYALCILSFLGAVHWGAALMSAQLAPGTFKPESVVWGVLPSLLAWAVAVFSPADFTLWLLVGTLLLVWTMDRRLLGERRGFEHYLRLRKHLTLGASVGLSLTAWFGQMV